MGFAVDALTLRLQIHYFGWGPYAAKPGSFLLAVCTTWWLNRHYTFVARRLAAGTQFCQEIPWPARFRSLLQEWGRYVSANALGAILNNGVYGLGIGMVPWLYRHPEAAVALGSLAGMGFNFYAATTWIFRTPTPSDRRDSAAGAAAGATRKTPIAPQ